MKIWIVNHYAVPPTQPGITRHHSLAKELIRSGHDVTIFASSFDHVTQKETRLKPGQRFLCEVIEGVTFVWIATPPYAGNCSARFKNMIVFAYRFLNGTGQKRLPKPDAIIGTTPNIFAAAAARWSARRFGAAFLFEVRDIWPDSLVEIGNVRACHPMVRLLGWLVRRLYRQSDHILTALPGAADHIAANGGDREKVTWLPNGVDFDIVPTPKPRGRSEVLSVMYAGAHGTLIPLDVILDAARILNDKGWGDRIRFRLLGDGPEKSRLKKRAADEGITNVVFEDPVPKNNVFTVLEQADVLVCTMRRLNLYKFGISFNKIYDYLAAARPIVFGCGSANNPVGEAGAGITVPPEDAPAIADAVIRLYEMSPAERWEMGLRGHIYAKEQHSMKRLAARLEGALELVAHDSEIPSTNRVTVYSNSSQRN